MKNRDIIVIGIQPWDIEIGSNCKNIAEIMSRENRVLYVNAPLDRKSRWSERKTEKIKKRIRVIKGNQDAIEQLTPGLWVLNPPTIVESINMLPDGRLFDFMNRINNRRFAREIRNAAKRLGFSNYFLFNDSNIFLGFYQNELLKPARYIYYMRDNLMQVPFWRKHGLRLEPQLIRKADIVVNNSTMLADYGKKYNVHSYMVGQGCDIDAYNNDIHDFIIPDEILRLKRPILGYVGFLSTRRLNISLMEDLAKARADWTIVLVGPEDDGFKVSLLHQLPNVFFTGPRKPEELPAYIQGFDVCINPQIINELTMGNYPRKIDEYLAMGKPTVASSTNAMDYFSEFVYLGTTTGDYINLIEKALVENSTELVAKRKEFARGHTWENNVNAIYKAIEEKRDDNLKSVPMSIIDKIKANPKLKQLVLNAMMPKNQARPRLWVKLFLNPLKHKKGKNARICRHTRMDVMPFNNFTLGNNSTIEDFCTVNNGVGDVIIGDRTRIGMSNVIIGPVTIGHDVMLAQNIVLSGLNHGYEDVTKVPHNQPVTRKPILIEDEVWVGANSIVLAGVTIGKHSIVGGGSVVTRNVPPYTLVAGNPARIIKRYNYQTGLWEKEQKQD